MLKRLWRMLTGKREESISSDFSHYEPMAKHYIFNETGNLMLCSTADSIRDFDNDIKDIFVDVSVFFAAMTKAISTTINTDTGKPFSIYNYFALKSIIEKSGMFIPVNEEYGAVGSKSVGENLGKEVLQKVLNRSFGERTLSFSRSMFSGMRREVSQGDTGATGNIKSANIFFICELLMGLPQVTAVLVSFDAKSGKNPCVKQANFDLDEDDKPGGPQDIFDLGAAPQNEHTHLGNFRVWKYEKLTYHFVPPKFIQNRIQQLNLDQSFEFDEIVQKLSESLIQEKG